MIIIKCIKGQNKIDNTDGYKKHERDNSIENELTIESHQWFMDTEEFFNSVKESLKEYFTVIEKK
jgi:hypothetical protein